MAVNGELLIVWPTGVVSEVKLSDGLNISFIPEDAEDKVLAELGVTRWTLEPPFRAFAAAISNGDPRTIERVVAFDPKSRCALNVAATILTDTEVHGPAVIGMRCLFSVDHIAEFHRRVFIATTIVRDLGVIKPRAPVEVCALHTVEAKGGIRFVPVRIPFSSTPTRAELERGVRAIIGAPPLFVCGSDVLNPEEEWDLASADVPNGGSYRSLVGGAQHCNYSDAIHGKVPNVVIVATGTAPGGGFCLRHTTYGTVALHCSYV